MPKTVCSSPTTNRPGSNQEGRWHKTHKPKPQHINHREKGVKELGHVRNGFSAVRPYVFGNMALWDMVQQTFAATLLVRHEMGDSANHIEAQIGDSVIILELSDPPHASGFPGSIYVYVEDVDLTYQRAVSAGAEVISAPEDKPYGERQAGIKDSYGNVWWIATMLAE
jgi:PhnB protein